MSIWMTAGKLRAGMKMASYKAILNDSLEALNTWVDMHIRTVILYVLSLLLVPCLKIILITTGLKFGIYSSAGFKTCEAYPASLGLEEIDAETYVDWDIDYLKYDNCYNDKGIPQHRYGPMSSALQSSGRPILYSLCEWGRENPAVWAPSISHSWRVSCFALM